MNVRKGPQLGLAVLLALAGCEQAPEGKVTTTTGPTVQPSRRFVGTWTSTEPAFRGTSQKMTIRPAEDGALDIALNDQSNWACSDRRTRIHRVDTPSKLTGRGRLEDATALVVPSPVLACADGREPAETGFGEEQGGISYTLVLDLATDRLFDNLGVAWHRGAIRENASDTTPEGSERTGPGTYAMLGGEVTFHVGRPWKDHIESYDPRLFFLLGPDGASIEILANPVPPAASCVLDAFSIVPASAEALVRTIRSDPDLEAKVPIAERVGGVDALRLDVAPASGRPRCIHGAVTVVSVTNSGSALMDYDELGRLYVLDLPGGSARALAIMITAPEAVFERTVELAAPVVDSFEFHTG